MDRKAKILAGILGGLLVLCLAGGIGFRFSGLGKRLAAEGKDLQSAYQAAEPVRKLNEVYAFDEPESGEINETRLMAYIEICTALRAAVDGARGGGGDGAETWRTEMVRAFGEALKGPQMSPVEFAWIHNTMQFARGEALMKGSKDGPPMPMAVRQGNVNRIVITEEPARDLPEDLPDTPEEAKKLLEQGKSGHSEKRPPEEELDESIEKALEPMRLIRGPLSRNALLYIAHREDLDACSLAKEEAEILVALGNATVVSVQIGEE